MNTTDLNKAIPVKEAMQTNQEIETLVHQVASGELSLESPCGVTLTPWTEEKKQEFKRVISREVAKLLD